MIGSRRQSTTDLIKMKTLKQMIGVKRDLIVAKSFYNSNCKFTFIIFEDMGNQSVKHVGK